ncbi:hypothetical protein CLOM_g17191 [Closterium sp. NIES-68]|nr:hypothetical protein CLOM_g17191 [Closterium sp. NIES-68]GJP63213.1 hypothetical protein CLOP_g20276 [Closterium sp. NIES-67]
MATPSQPELLELRTQLDSSAHPCHPTPRRFSSSQESMEGFECVLTTERSTTSPSSRVNQFHEPTISSSNFAGP